MTEEETISTDTDVVETTGQGPASMTDTSECLEARLDRILDYQTSALSKDDPLQANLGSVNSGLMTIAVQFDAFIGQVLAGGPATIERMQKLLPLLDAHLRVTRQIDRYAQIELKATAPRKGDSERTPTKPR